MPLVSVIIPIYKVEKYLKACVDSVIAQTYEKLEIILVDDGSPDGCGLICDGYKEQDSRIRVLHKENGGLSDARNAGLAIATGDYICFVDSDDILPRDSVEQLLLLARKHAAQIVIGGFERFEDCSGEVFFKTDAAGVSTEVMNRAELMKNFYVDGCQAWAVLYERKIHNGIVFPKGEINEDEAIVFQIYDRCERAVVTNNVVYSYRHREESITTSSFSAKKLVWQKHCADNLEFVREHYPELVPDAAARYRGSLLWSLTEMALSNEDFSSQIRKLLTALKDNKKLFKSAPFDYPQDKIRMWMLTNLPFGVYRTFIRVKRKV